MLNIQEVENTIEMLENQETSYANCQKLASLYLVKYFYNDKIKTDDEVIGEYSDIRSAYESFKIIKREYQLNKLPKAAVEKAISKVCKEVYEFLHILYSNSDMPEEREYLSAMLDKIYNEIK